MNVSTTIPATVQIRRSRLLGLIGGVAALAAAVTWALSAYAVDTSEKAQVAATGVAATSGATALSAQEQRALDLVNSLTPDQLRGIRFYWTPGSTGLAAQEQRALDLVNSLTPAQLSGIRYYWTPGSTSLAGK